MAYRTSNLQEWADRIERFRRSNTSAAQFCRNERISVHALYYWRKRLDAHSAKKQIVPNKPLIAGGGFQTLPNDHSGSCVLRFTIESGATRIQCDCSTLQAIDHLLTWAGNQHSGRFQQVIVPS